MKTNKLFIIEFIVSILIMISIILIVMNICLKINSESKKVDYDTEAIRIVTSVLENMKTRKYSEITEYLQELSVVGISKTIDENSQTIIVNGSEFQGNFFETLIPSNYRLELNINNVNEELDILKNINIKVKYILNYKEEELEINTVLEREIVDDCNRPEITEEYFKEINIDFDEYEIIPIKYSYDKKSYVTTTEGDDEWYNYYAKEWAKVLVLSKYGEDLKSYFINEDGTVNQKVNYDNNVLDLDNYMYVWIPNFSIRDNTSYFRYESGKNAIRQDLLYSNGKYLYMNIISDTIEDITEECSFNGINGVWRKVDSLNSDVYGITLSKTRFGPINLH